MTLGYDRPLYVVRLDRRNGPALDPSAAATVLRGVRQVAAAGSTAGPGELAVLVDAGPSSASPALDVDLGEHLVAVAALSSDDADFQLAAEHGFGHQLEAIGAAVAHVEVRWGTDHDPQAKQSQAIELTRLAAWLHETGRSLLVELAVPGLGRLTGPERTDELLKTVREVREVGIEADLWALPGPLDAEAAQALCELVRDAGRDDVGILVTDTNADADAVAVADDSAGSGAADGQGAADGRGAADDTVAALRAVAGVPGVVGFVLGPAIWSDALGRGRAAATDAVTDAADDPAATAVADRLRQAIAATGATDRRGGV